MQNKNHWYDGWFYDKIIAPNQDRMFFEIKKMISPNTSVLDVGCGTGRLSFKIADKVDSIVGIDLSKKNIETATKSLLRSPNEKISFKHTTITELIKENYHFDYALITYVIHEVNPEERILLLREMMLIADKIIIGDYLTPVKSGLWNLLNEIVEFLAGREHYKNYKNFIIENGLIGLINKTNLTIVEQIINRPVTSQILLLKK